MILQTFSKCNIFYNFFSTKKFNELHFWISLTHELLGPFVIKSAYVDALKNKVCQNWFRISLDDRFLLWMLFCAFRHFSSKTVLLDFSKCSQMQENRWAFSDCNFRSEELGKKNNRIWVKIQGKKV